MESDIPLGLKPLNLERFKNEVRQAGQKCDKQEGSTKTDSHKSNKRHKLDTCHLLPKGPRYECYTPLTANHTIILEEAFNLEVPIKIPPMLSPRMGLDKTTYYEDHHSYGHNTKDCCALKDKIEELIQTRYLAKFVKRLENHQARERLEGNQEDQHKIEEDRDTINRDMIDNLHKNRSPPNKSEV
ncbi:hypothetical protein JHK86_018961 [Glycine max]|nr:hypothetical protein JHK86_018961 [Glycine max]